jgi:hypothetical protein
VRRIAWPTSLIRYIRSVRRRTRTSYVSQQDTVAGKLIPAIPADVLVTAEELAGLA